MKLHSSLKVLLMLGVVLGLVAGTSMVTIAAEEETILHKGMNHSKVKTLQRQLKDYDYYDFHIDGMFGSLTYKGVKDLQKNYNLTVDGIVGPKTKKALKRVKSLKRQFKKAPVLNRGSRNKDVKTVQKELKRLNYYGAELDGIYGPLTEEAVTTFQKTNQITVDGIVGPETYAALIRNPVKNEGITPRTANAHSSSNKTTQTKTKKKVNQNKNANKTVDAGTKQNSKSKDIRTFSVTSTAYTAHCNGCSGITATGINLLKNPGKKVVAVDPKVIPLGSKVWVEGYGTAVAGDTGGAIKGNKIDVFIPDYSKALHWGRKTVKIKILE